MHDDAYIGGRSENNIKCIVHDDLGVKEPNNSIYSSASLLYEWFSQFHWRRTYSVLSWIPSIVFCNIRLCPWILTTWTPANKPKPMSQNLLLLWPCQRVTSSMQLSVVSQCDVDAYHRCSVCSCWLTLCCVLYFVCNGSSLTGVIILWHMFVVVTRPTTDVMEQMVSWLQYENFPPCRRPPSWGCGTAKI